MSAQSNTLSLDSLLNEVANEITDKEVNEAKEMNKTIRRNVNIFRMFAAEPESK
ncbi:MULTISPECIES: hypothetical protein [unclassified Sporolactobacillus]|uniref:hypothetical protein n=1 Tax=unclassified Sporolactobacillus TaxID=2628533 RepID=UPI0023681BE7|nr:hypothetical protein [Sporolactobacillus sp. CQH2019]MDD9150468.1 hypothetical protein [Sporolactobacillus sp. CQH2019]